MKIPLFDIDWTLLKSNKAHSDAFDYAFRKVYGIDASKKELDADKKPDKGRIDNQIIIDVLMLHALKKEEIIPKLKEATKVMANYFFEHEDEADYTPLPGVLNILKEFEKLKIPTGVLTGNVEKIGWRKLEKAGIKKYFSFGAFGNLALKRIDLIPIAQKRAEKVLSRKISIDDLFIIGDTPKDIKCAKDAGIKSIAVTTGQYSFEDLSEADLIVKSLNEKEKILDFLEK